MEKTLITFQAEKELYEKIRREAFNQDVSKSEIIRQACNKFFELQVQEEKE